MLMKPNLSGDGDEAIQSTKNSIVLESILSAESSSDVIQDALRISVLDDQEHKASDRFEEATTDATGIISESFDGGVEVSAKDVTKQDNTFTGEDIQASGVQAKEVSFQVTEVHTSSDNITTMTRMDKRRSSVGEAIRMLLEPIMSLFGTESQENLSENGSSTDIPPSEGSDLDIVNTNVDSGTDDINP
jgi:hypothetical protein